MTISQTQETISLEDLPSHMRALADEMGRIGAAIRYYGGFGTFAEYGDMLEVQSAPLLRVLALQMEKMRGVTTQ